MISMAVLAGDVMIDYETHNQLLGKMQKNASNMSATLVAKYGVFDG